MLKAITCAAMLIASPALATNSCALTFPLTASAAIGEIATGTTLSGTAQFRTGELMKQEGDTLSYVADGLITVVGPDGSKVTGKIGYVHVMRTPYTADYISIDASGVTGALGGETRYEDPMLITLYAKPGTLPGVGFPAATDCQKLDKRRVFQVHTPDTMAIFPARIDALTVTCQ